MIETPPGGGQNIDASHSQGVQIGEHNRQINYNTQIVDGRVKRRPRITVYGEIESPYKGLSSFSEDDAAFFFGRDQAIDDIMGRLSERLHTRIPLVVSGASGAGKSSLLSAGVLPRIAAAGLPGLPGARSWPRVTLTPARAPLAELAAAVAPLARTDAGTLRRSLTADPRGFADIAHSITSMIPNGLSRLVIVVDQFEQVFTQCEDASERDKFIAALHAAASERRGQSQAAPALVVLAGRADFEARFAEHEELTEAVQSRYLVTAMTERQLRLAITRPAEVANAAVDPRLADELVRATRGSGSAVLPHLSHALDQAWRHRADDDVLRLEDYDAAGGLEGSIRASADLAFGSLTEAQQTAARPVFMQLVKVSSDLAVSAGQATRSELASGQTPAPDVDAVIEAFASERLLTVDEVFVEISHEVLLIAWGTLRGWLDGDRVDLAQYSRLTADAYDWESRGRPASYLYPPGRLAEVDAAAQRWASVPGRYPALGQAARAFLEAARRSARRARARRQGAITGLSVLTVAAVTAAGFATNYASDAKHQALIAGSRALAGQSMGLAQSDPLAADQLAAAAWHESPTAQAASAMTTLLAQQEHSGALAAGSHPNVALSHDGTLLATVSQQTNYLRLWSTATGKPAGAPLAVGPSSGDLGAGAAFSPDGRMVASLGQNQGLDTSYLRLWNPATGTLIRDLPIPASTVIDRIVFNPDGKTLIGSDDMGDILQWDVATGAQVGSALRTGDLTVNDVAVSPDGRLIAVAGTGDVGIWNLATGLVVAKPWRTKDALGFMSVAFSPDGRLLASGDEGGNVRLWNMTANMPAGAPLAAGNNGNGASVAFSADGRTLATSVADGQVKLWNPATGQLVGTMTEASPDDGDIAFSPTTGLLATAETNGTVQLWNVAARQPVASPVNTAFGTQTPGAPPSDLPVRFSPQGNLLTTRADGYVGITTKFTPAGSWTGGADGVASANGRVVAQPTGSEVRLTTPTGVRVVPSAAGPGIALSPDGSLLATAYEQGTTNYLRLWSTTTGAPAGPAVSTGAHVFASMTFSPDGTLLAIGYQDGAIQLWNPATSSLIHTSPSPDISKSDPVYAMAFSPDGKSLATAAKNAGVAIWDSSMARRLATLNTGSSALAQALAYSPDGTLLATGYDDGTIQLWNTATSTSVGGPMPTGATGQNGSPISRLTFSQDGSLLLSAAGDSYVTPWEVWKYANPYAALCDIAGPPPSGTTPGIPSGVCADVPTASALHG